ncbi:gamma-glutamylcyclotransferase [Trinickia sp. Y13]|uniref:gamma-glutamylcyclotransferase n=1 Tax=Trinickia sp. Y13 TaxID=2917807 RepID=UPI002406F8CB|nr:gamma-glutamylcyclotransferase [Trinickia sp. Y13]MDG0025513.1 gamma-glutamylcyclotransferase [Trinickia sp. Y13]
MLSDEQRAWLLREALDVHQPGAPIWFFAYGSRIWRPALPAAETVGALVEGYHRKLCLWSCVSRGTHKRPRLVLALDEGGECRGVAHRIDAEHVDAALAALWDRELVMDSYRPRWLPCLLDGGREVMALTFVLRKGAPNHAGEVTDTTDTTDTLVRHVLRHAARPHGSALEYLAQTVARLQAHGIRDEHLEGLLQRCGP